MRAARHSIWARAKHRSGLERPHLLGAFSRPKTSWGRSSPHVYEKSVAGERELTCC